MNKLLMSLIVAVMLFAASLIHAEVRYISPQKLAARADVILIGTVQKITSSRETMATSWNKKVPIAYATIKVEQTLKGSVTRSVTVKYAYDTQMEADVQDPNLAFEKKVLIYLVSNHDTRHSYHVVNGWSGVGRFYKNNFYHQYDRVDVNMYIKELKEYIK